MLKITRGQTRKTGVRKENSIAVDLYESTTRKRGEESREINSRAESRNQIGRLEPLLIKPDGTILSGRLRYRAAKKAKIKELRVDIAEPRDRDEEEHLIITTNRNKKKTPSMLLREIEALERIFTAQEVRGANNA